MRILILSDSHGSTNRIMKAIGQQPTADFIIHLGDGERDTLSTEKNYPEKKFIHVSGNCDFCPENSLEKIECFNQCKIFLCHGHTYHVKAGLEELFGRAQSIGCNIALFGHTHQPLMEYRNGLYLMNPGSIGRGMPKSYGIVDITRQGIVCNTATLH